MKPLILMLAPMIVAAYYGCPQQQPIEAPAETVPLTPVKNFETGLEFDPATAAPGQAGFGWGLGSSSVNIIGRRDGQCLFDYSSEVEGGWILYRVSVPVDGPPVKVYEDNCAIVTSFSLAEAKELRQGNVHFAPADEALKELLLRAPNTQLSVPETDFVNYIRDSKTGEGDAALEGDEVRITYQLFVDTTYSEPRPGFEEPQELKVRLGEFKVGRGLDFAIRGMRPGGVRWVSMREEVADEFRRAAGGWQPSGTVAAEIRLLEVE